MTHDNHHNACRTAYTTANPSWWPNVQPGMILADIRFLYTDDGPTVVLEINEELQRNCVGAVAGMVDQFADVLHKTADQMSDRNHNSGYSYTHVIPEHRDTIDKHTISDAMNEEMRRVANVGDGSITIVMSNEDINLIHDVKPRTNNVERN